MGRYITTIRADQTDVYQRPNGIDWTVSFEEGKGAGVTINATAEDVFCVAEEFVKGLVRHHEWDMLRDLADQALEALADHDEAFPCEGSHMPADGDVLELRTATSEDIRRIITNRPGGAA